MSQQSRFAWALARRQHGVLSAAQLAEAGYGRHAIAHRVRIGRLHRVRTGVYAVGRPELTRQGEWMAAVLACGSRAALSHGSALALWGIEPVRSGAIHVSVRDRGDRRSRGLVVHRRPGLPADDFTRRQAIPVTAPARTLLDLAAVIASTPRGRGFMRLEAAVNASDKLDLLTPGELRSWLDERRGERGVRVLRRLLDRSTFRLTDSELERRFLRLVRHAGLPLPETGVRLCGFKIDFVWRAAGVIVETDGLRYHRTPTQQSRDARRDQVLTEAGFACLRFTHAEVRHEPERVARVVAGVLARGLVQRQ